MPPRLPVFKLVIDEDAEGMDYMGLVDYPAHGKNWITLSKKLPKKVDLKYHFNEEKRIVTGVAIATDLQIYRRNEDGFEYNIVFTKEETFKMLKMFSKRGHFNNVNFMHDMGRKAEGVYLIEMFLINAEKSNIPTAFIDQNLQPGSLIFSYWVEDDESWKFVKENGAGFSIEGWFKEVEIKFNRMKKTFVTISQVNKWDINVIESEITLGSQLHILDYEKKEVRLCSGEYSYDGHKLMVDSDGKVVMIDGKIDAVTLSKKVINSKKNMKKKSLMERLFGKKPDAAPTKHVYDKTKKDKYKSATTVDGIEVTWEGELAEKTPLFVVPTDGTDPVLATAGDYAIDIDGVIMVCTVDDAGLISAVVEGEEMDDAEIEAALAAIKKDYEKKLADQRKAMKAEFDAQVTEMATDIDELREVVESFAEGKLDANGKPKKVLNSHSPGWRKKKRTA